jgi:hypothetical protein
VVVCVGQTRQCDQSVSGERCRFHCGNPRAVNAHGGTTLFGVTWSGQQPVGANLHYIAITSERRFDDALGLGRQE